MNSDHYPPRISWRDFDSAMKQVGVLAASSSVSIRPISNVETDLPIPQCPYCSNKASEGRGQHVGDVWVCEPCIKIGHGIPTPMDEEIQRQEFLGVVSRYSDRSHLVVAQSPAQVESFFSRVGARSVIPIRFVMVNSEVNLLGHDPDLVVFHFLPGWRRRFDGVMERLIDQHIMQGSKTAAWDGASDPLDSFPMERRAKGSAKVASRSDASRPVLTGRAVADQGGILAPRNPHSERPG